MAADFASVTSEEAAAAFALVEKFDHLLLAVSGGPDSLSLLLLASEWKARRGTAKPSVSVATVDHGLRPQSASEAEMVGRVAAGLGLEHATLLWEGQKPDTGIAEAARNERYRLLEEHALAVSSGSVAVVTAHHRDDQAETFVMRLARGSGVDGLACMQPLRPIRLGSPVTLARPLLGFAKERLCATVAAHGIEAVHDASNDDERSERVRRRKSLLAFVDADISSAAIATSARRIGEALTALAYGETAFRLTLKLSYGNEVYASLDRAAFAAGPRYLRHRVLSSVVDRFGGAVVKPGLSQIEHLDQQIESGSKITATVGGATVSAGERWIKIWREAGRLTQTLVLSPGEAAHFDQRFVVRCGPDAPSAVEVRALGQAGIETLGEWRETRGEPPNRAAMAQPAFWRAGELLAAPTLEPFAKKGFARWVSPMYQVHSLLSEQN